MGKKGRRTRWRTLTIADEHSDSEESNTTSSGPKGYPHKSYYGRFTYSSQSTPTRRYQCGDGTKSTRSSSTASENKITFNEDEYTRITTPRQDVLFKKGYLNKPKAYQTQTSTGNSTTSTGNSTGNGTPDHQSTDLEYESQFVFPNGFVDQNGIYYVNSFEPYPVMVYNPPTFFPEYTSVKSKRCSTGSLTESTSPNNEETSQDLSQSETPSDVGHIYNIIYPGFYYNGACQPQEEEFVNPEATCEPEPRRMKKRRRRKLSRSKQEGTTTTTTTTSESSEEILSDEEEEEEEMKSEDLAAPAQTLVVEEPEMKKDEEKEEKPEEEEEETVAQKEETEEEETKPKYDLKPDAEEFVPRAYRHHETIPIEANVQFIKLPSNFVPVPILNPMGEFNAFIPPGIPINFVPQNYVNFVQYKPINNQIDVKKEEETEEEKEETVEVPIKNQIDIAKIVSKLEEAVKEQREEVKEETKVKNVKKKQKFQKVELRRPEKQEFKEWKKEEFVKKPARNYSETLKKSFGQTERDSEKKVKSPIKDTAKNQIVEKLTPPKVSSEWIAVSRKKRKNKNVEESEDFAEEKTEAVEEKLPEELTQPEPVVEEIKPTIEETKPAIEEIKEEKKPKKKSKKNHAKSAPVPPVTRRVIITDVDLSVEETIEDRKPIEEMKTLLEDEEMKIVLENEDALEKAEIAVVEDVEVEKKEPEKKSKKKKKKLTKSVTLSGHSDSNGALNVTDDSYDFLLDESLDKTNVEVSQELDKMIQRGMYSNLEEKIKSMNIESSTDTFFKTIISNISSRESSVEKNNPYITPPNLTKLIASNRSAPKPGDFLSETATPGSPPVGGGANPSSSLYPITTAVREWMSKTRETTPDVELLKSPSAIFKEFGLDDDEEGEGLVAETPPLAEKEAELEDSPEIRDETKKKYPKHANLPYRAICCSIM